MTRPCDPIEPLLTRYLLEDLDAFTQARVNEHVSSCPHCQTVLGDLKPTLGLLRAALAVPSTAPERLSPEHRRRIFSPARRGRIIHWPKIHWSDLTAVQIAVALIACCFVAGFLLRSHVISNYELKRDRYYQLLISTPSPSSPYASAKPSDRKDKGRGQPVKPAGPVSPDVKGVAAETVRETVRRAPMSPLPVAVQPKTPSPAPGLSPSEVTVQAAVEKPEDSEPPVAIRELETPADEKIRTPKTYKLADASRRMATTSGVKKLPETKTPPQEKAKETRQPVTPAEIKMAQTKPAPESIPQPAASASPPPLITASLKPADRIPAKADKAGTGISNAVPPMTIKQQGDGHAPTGTLGTLAGLKPSADIQPFVRVSVNPISLFSMNVDTSSYKVACHYMINGKLPPVNTVRTEAFINAFDYTYPAPTSGAFAIYTECAPTPFRHGLHVLKIGIKARLATGEEPRPWPHVIAAVFRAHVEFNPACVKRYRLLGYEGRRPTTQSSRNEKGDYSSEGVSAGQSVTVLYELEVNRSAKDAMGAVKLHYRDAKSGIVMDISQPIPADTILPKFEETDVRFRLAVAAAEFAELLRGSPFTGGHNYDNVARALRPVAREMKQNPRVQELLRWVQDAKNMRRSE